MRCVALQDLCDLVLTHMGAAQEMVDNKGVLANVTATEKKLDSFRGSLSNGNWKMLRQAVLRFVQDQWTKISILLDKGLQNKAGIMRLPKPGEESQGPGKWTRLGGNMYAGANQEAPPATSGRGGGEGGPKPPAPAAGETPASAAAQSSSLADRRGAEMPS